MGDSTTYTLYHNWWSLCSLMVRYTLAVRGEAKDGGQISFEEHNVDIQHNIEQLSEFYLCNVNAKGQVPALTGPTLKQPIADSQDITHHLGDLFPRLMPDAHKKKIVSLIKGLHDINFFSLFFTNNKTYAPKSRQMIEDRLQSDISEEYRKALEYKIKVNQSAMNDALEPETVDTMVDRTHQYFDSLLQYLPTTYTGGKLSNASGPWLFGFQHPSALDTHVATFLVRLQESRRAAMVPEPLKEYAQMAQKTKEWKEMMGDRDTVPPASKGDP